MQQVVEIKCNGIDWVIPGHPNEKYNWVLCLNFYNYIELSGIEAQKGDILYLVFTEKKWPWSYTIIPSTDIDEVKIEGLEDSYLYLRFRLLLASVYEDGYRYVHVSKEKP